MKNTIVWVIVVLVVIIGALWFMSSSDTDTPADANPEGQEQEQEAQSIVISLNEQNDSGMYGSATLAEVDDGTFVAVSLVGAPAGIAQPAHIHAGSCADIGGVVYPLEFPLDGVSETVLDVSLSDILSQLPLALNVHKSPEEAQIYVACGDLTRN